MSKEVKMYYNHDDKKYYIYEGEEFIADTPSFHKALMFFIPLVTGNITIETKHHHDKTERIEQYGVTRTIYSI